MKIKISDRQAEIFRFWLTENNLEETLPVELLRPCLGKVRSTAKHFEINPEKVKQTVAAVLTKLKRGQELPPPK
jgi:hypothetical protein